MKYFKIDGHFKLPDDFTGDIVEAILVMIGYAKKNNKLNDFEYDNTKSPYENWFTMVTTYPDSNIILDTSISELVDGQWVVIQDTLSLKKNN